VIAGSERAADQTPMAWRAAALALLAAGAGLGSRIARLPARRVAVGSGLVGLATIAVVREGTRRALEARRAGPPAAAGETKPPAPPGPGSPQPLPRISVVIAARDEILALPALIRDLGRQDHRAADGSPAFDVVVVDDRSTDGSGAAARAAAEEAGLGAVTVIVRRQAGSRPDGKGAALAAVPDEILQGDAVLVFDADARIEADFVRRVAVRVGDGCAAFTARRRVAGSDLRAAVQDDEQTVDTLVQRARGGLGGCPEFRGNGMVVTTARLRAIGGWRAGTLTEDLDLSTRLAIGGARVVLADDLEVWEAATGSLPAFARQRVRWAEGSLRRFLDLLPAAITSSELSLTAKVDLASSAAQLLLPSVVLGAVFDGARRRSPRAALAFVGGCAATTWALAWMALRDATLGPGPARQTATRAAVTAVYLLHWVAVTPATLVRVALRPGAVTFARTRERRLPPTT
jgi:1,2-diacylglycerol 3-beta-glucosyltransferase